MFQSFPDDFKKQYADKSIIPGQVIRINFSFPDKTKPKFLIIATADDPPLLFVINSNIHQFIQDRPYLLEAQIKISPEEYSFLNHSSYINASRVFDTMTRQDIADQITKDINCIKGMLSSRTIRKLLAVVEKSKTLTPQEKQRITNTLKPLAK